MAKFDKSVLEKYGITGTTEVLYNPSYEVLFNEETKEGLEGYEKGHETELGAINVMTGIYTGRSPKDKFIVDDENSHDTVWWDSEEYHNDNHRASKEAWTAVKDIAKKELSNKRLFVVDGFCGTHKDTRMKIRFIVEVAWQAHFVTNMFIRPKSEADFDQEPDFIVYNASKAKVENWKELGLHSETCVMFNVTSKEQVIVNTWYGGEMKKGMFSMMNYFLPLKGMASMHCSANTDMNGENTAIFFGLSGTGKTTLSTDPKRKLIGDDEHGWDDKGIFNYEGGCYAKVINLDKESEPDIYGAITRDALLENVTVDENGKIDFADKSVTENTRVSYPIYHIKNIQRPESQGPAAKQVIFLSADAFGVLPPVSILTPEQTKYYFLSGFTAKLAGTERGITEPTPTFSACFGQAFLELHPTKYAEELVKKMQQSGAKAYLVNTGWNGTGKTTLSTDPKRKLIGDDEHGWDDKGIFNYEGGCYAKVINLDKESEPDIYGAITRDALLENVTVDKNGKIDFADKSVTENTRVSYPIYHIKNIQRPESQGPAAKQVIFLSADAFGVLPPVSILTPEQTKYYFLSGFTAKLAGTERGITEPTPTFSACFGQAFLELHPTKYAEELVKKMQQSGAKAYLVNTGWNGTGKRISIRDTRGIIDAILNHSIDAAPTKQIPYFDFTVPTKLEGVATEILDPRDTYADAAQWDEKAKDLAARFIKNFKKYENNEAGKALVAAGPQL